MRVLILLPVTIIGACAPQVAAVDPRAAAAQPLAAAQVDHPATEYPPPCAAEFPPNPNIAAWSADKFTGTFRSGALALTVRRSGNHLLVEQPGRAATQINSDSAESWQFVDRCGATYGFMLPPDGPGAWLTVTTAAGQRSDWHRTGF